MMATGYNNDGQSRSTGESLRIKGFDFRRVEDTYYHDHETGRRWWRRPRVPLVLYHSTRKWFGFPTSLLSDREQGGLSRAAVAAVRLVSSRVMVVVVVVVMVIIGGDLNIVKCEYEKVSAPENTNAMRLPIDRFLVSPDILVRIPNLAQVTLSRSISNHNPIVLKMVAFPRGPRPSNGSLVRRMNLLMWMLLGKYAVSVCMGVCKLEEREWLQKSRLKWFKAGDQSTKFCYATIVLRGRSNHISCIRVGTGVVEDPIHISKVIEQQFRRCYNSDSTLPIKRFDVHLNKPCVSSRKAIEEPFSEEEVWSIISSSNESKAPGLDRFYVEFYKKFWSSIKRAGCLLSSFLFNLVGEALSALINKVVEVGRIKGVQIGMSSLSLSHLYLAGLSIGSNGSRCEEGSPWKKVLIAKHKYYARSLIPNPI
ncbi:hypothetical protein F3Y22_tig00117034pilonHSYRG00053 [Hibiscus syriacus]|uniref:Uncharacterized protein n=1 Tax=Hibiscus syriacus TaxID=106335 RepID=A0A6A2WFS8_HIBSY|nr:hypothetical protein F3Y22_tig00117034pilonHSYRG00053 [Hibiscus syriacus]